MQWVGLVESPAHVCARYRLAAFAPVLAGRGVTLSLVARPKTLPARLRLYRRLRRADAVIVQRLLLPRVEVAALRHFARRLVFDFDDALWMRDSYSPKGFESVKRARRFRRLCRAADVVCAGNATLAAEAAKHGRGRVRVVPTCVDPAAYPLAAHAGGPARLVWVGSGSTLRGLNQLLPHLAAVAAAVPNVSLRLICDRTLPTAPLPVELVPWSAATEAADLAACDIGISWVPDDPWSRGKCGLKLLQYHAAGLPAVTNPVGVHPEIVQSGVTGELVATPAEWAAVVASLAADPERRRRVGHAGRAQVEERYSVEAGARLWLDALGPGDV